MRAPRLIIFLAVLSLSSLVLGQASANPGDGGDREAAREEARLAAVAFNLGHYDEAASLYEQAYKRVSDPVLLYDIGQCHRLAHEPAEALTAYRSYLRTAPEGVPNRESVERMIDDLEWDLAASQSKPNLVATVPRVEASPTFPWKRWAPWAGTGITVALAAAAIAEGISTDSTFSGLQSTCGKTRSCTDSQIGGDRSKATTTNVLWGLAAASAVATGVSFYLDLAGGKGAGISLSWGY
jgi:tetratricopeptide (TPR) repeat protein